MVEGNGLVKPGNPVRLPAGSDGNSGGRRLGMMKGRRPQAECLRYEEPFGCACAGFPRTISARSSVPR